MYKMPNCPKLKLALMKLGEAIARKRSPDGLLWQERRHEMLRQLLSNAERRKEENEDGTNAEGTGNADQGDTQAHMEEGI